MEKLTALIAAVLNVLAIFASVSFVTSAAVEVLSTRLRWREALLLRGVKDLLYDPMFNGLARAVYNHPLVNLRMSRYASTEAQLTAKPSSIDPNSFAIALLELLQIIPTQENQPGAIPGPLPFAPIAPADGGEVRLRNAVANATLVIDRLDSSDEARKELSGLAVNMIVRQGAQPDAMTKSVAAWFILGMSSVTDDYRRRTQIATLLLAFVLAVFLDLKPFPPGGFDAANAQAALGVGGDLGKYLPIATDVVQWGVVALSTLFGGQFWLNAIKGLQSVSRAGQLPEGAKQPLDVRPLVGESASR